MRARYPELSYVENGNWERNNILGSLLCARERALRRVRLDVRRHRLPRLDREEARRLGATTRCSLATRTGAAATSTAVSHPETDAEKMRADGDVVLELSRRIASERASGEFIGVTKFSGEGAREMVGAFDEAQARHAAGPWREGRTFERAYLIDLFQEMIEHGSTFHRVDTHGGYMEIDTREDLACAEKWWRESVPE